MPAFKATAGRPHPAQTTTCQQILNEVLDHSKLTGSLTVMSDLTHPKLYPVATGHVVNERVLTPSTLYAEIAMTIADYMYKALAGDSAAEIGLNVCEMEVHKPLMVHTPPPPEGQFIQIHCAADLNKGEMKIQVLSVTPEGKTLQDHGHGLVRYEDPAVWAEEWKRQQHLVRSQIDILESKVATGGANKLPRHMAYQLFENLVTYSPRYQGMREVILESSADASAPAKYTAAFAHVELRYKDGKDGDFFLSPYAIDNLCHLSGFITNAADTDSDEPLVFISHGWESLKFLDPQGVGPERKYTTFVRMVLGEKNISKGDVYVFDESDGGEIVAVLYGLKFQGIPRRLMDVLLPPKRKVVTIAPSGDTTTVRVWAGEYEVPSECMVPGNKGKLWCG